jgi:predicted nucleotidyltransferase
MPAIINKTSRCEMAMLNGADLVIELPVVYSTASAELFATASIALLDSLNCIDYLCFGCETDSIDLLNTVAEILINEPKEYKDLLTLNLKTGISFPKARAKALDEYFKKYNLDYSLNINSNNYAKYPSDITSNSNLDINTFINQPNNILGIEYIKALMRFNSKNEETTEYSEYKNHGPGAATKGRVAWSHQLSKKEAGKVTIAEVFGEEAW